MNVYKLSFSWPFRRQTLVSLLLAVAIILPGSIAFTPLLVRPAYADHDSTRVECPDPIAEGDTANVRVRKSGYIVKELYAYTYIGGYTADGSDFECYDHVKFTNESGSRSVYIPAITKEDDKPEPNETFSIGFWREKAWHGCVITIVDDDEPEIASVVITSRPVEGVFYRYGESIEISVTLE